MLHRWALFQLHQFTSAPYNVAELGPWPCQLTSAHNSQGALRPSGCWIGQDVSEHAFVRAQHALGRWLPGLALQKPLGLL